MTDFCALCLSVDRNLSIINQEMLEVLIPLLKASNFSIFKLTGRILNICWECRARLKGINTFRNMAFTSLKYMISYWDSNLENIQPKTSHSRLTTTSTTHIRMEQALDIKESQHFEFDIDNEDNIVIKEEEFEFETFSMNTENDPLTENYVLYKSEEKTTLEPGNTENSCAKNTNVKEKPLTAAERQKRYRERLKKQNPEKYAEIKRKNADRTRSNARRKKHTQTVEEMRRKWRDEKRRYKRKKLQQQNQTRSKISINKEEN